MHKKYSKMCPGCRVNAAKIYLYHSNEIAKARPHSEDWQTDSSVQKQWSMPEPYSSGLQNMGVQLLWDAENLHP